MQVTMLRANYLPRLGYERMALVNIIGGIQVYLTWFFCYLIGRKVALFLGFLLSFLIFVPLMYGSKFYLPCVIGQQLGTLLIYHGQTKATRELSRDKHIVTLQLTFLKEILYFSDLTFKITNTIAGEIGINWPIPWITACIFILSQSILIMLEIIKYRGAPPLAKDEYEVTKIAISKIKDLMEIEDIFSPILNCFLSGMSGSFMGVIYSRVLKKLLPGRAEDVTDAEIAFSGAMIELGGVILNRIVKVDQRTKDVLVFFGICFHVGLIVPIFYQKTIFYTSKSMLLLSSAIIFKMKDVLPVDNTMGTINACPSHLKTTLFALYSTSTSLGKALVLFILPKITLKTILLFHLLVAVLKELAYIRARRKSKPGPRFTKDAATQKSK